MRIALISDIHANIIALQAVLEAIQKHHVERIISLGDQVNLGPCPRETLDLLKAEKVTCLHGNHERYILSAMENDPAYAGINFQSLRFNASLLSPEDITFKKDLSFGNVILTHAVPGDDRFPVYDAEKAVPRLLDLTFDSYKHIICGHGHNPTYYALPNLSLHSIGSVGCMDDGIPGSAPFVIAEIGNTGVSLRPYYAQYDPSALKPLFLSCGMADFCPIMARIACMEMTDNKEYLVGFVKRARERSAAKGESEISQATWSQTDRTYPWPDDLTTGEYWRQM